jgi:hypothetical protein
MQTKISLNQKKFFLTTQLLRFNGRGFFRNNDSETKKRSVMKTVIMSAAIGFIELLAGSNAYQGTINTNENK